MGLLSESNIRFLDRETETRLVWRYIVSTTPGLIGIHGPGGIGKTVLLWWAADECTRQNLPRVYIDLSHFHFNDTVDLMREIAVQLQAHLALLPFRELLAGYRTRFERRFQAIREHGALPPADLQRARAEVMAAFVHGFQQLSASQKVVVLLDNIEFVRRRSDRERLESELLAKLSRLSTVRVVIASRAQMQWRDAALVEAYRPIHLHPFDEHYARDLSRGVLPRLLEREPYLRALRVSGGHPYSVQRLARIGAQYFDLPDDELYERLMEDLWSNVIARFMLKGVDVEIQDTLSRMAIVRFFDMSGLRYFAQRAGVLVDALPFRFVDLIDTLNRDVSAVRFDEVRKGYRLQVPIRPVSLELHRLTRDIGALNDLALEFYATWLRELPPGLDEWRRCIIEMTYHRAVLSAEIDETKAMLARALTQLRARKNLEAAIKLRDELGQDRDLPAALWQEIFAFFEEQELAGAA
jgi:hypothetical protein